MPSIKKLLQAAAGNAGGETLGYVEDVFSTYLYTGNSSTQTITNDIDLAGEGGLVWLKNRVDPNGFNDDHALVDTARGGGSRLSSNSPAAADTAGDTTFNADGFTLSTSNRNQNYLNGTYASWTFRKAEKFFDVVTYTGTGSARTVAHNLGSVPGMIIVKGTDIAENWIVYHRSLGATKYIQLNTTGAAGTSSIAWNDTEPTSTEFTVNTFNAVNEFGYSYVAYLFAHDAGGFGDNGSESIINCGSFAGASDVNLGYEPQWILLKRSDGGNDWWIFDTMRGWLAGSDTASVLRPNLSNPEFSTGLDTKITSTGFTTALTGFTYIYIAIRRPMKTPTAGTEVFAMNTPISTTKPTWNSGFVTDFAWYKNVDAVYGNYWYSRLTGVREMQANSTAAEITSPNAVWDFMDGFGQWTNGSGVESWMLKRATGFFDVVCFDGDGVAGHTLNHNLGVVPELMIVKRRSATEGWQVYHKDLDVDEFLEFDTGSVKTATGNFSRWNNTRPTDSVFTVGGTWDAINASGSTYINYLFATLAGVSKVGSYTGTAATLNVDCGFSAGARFILIKRTDSTGDWYVWDSERGIVAGNDPYFLLNSNAAQVTNTDYIDPLSSGFTVTSSAPAALNASGGNYIFLAIA